MAYFIMFGLSALACVFAERCRRLKKKKQFLFWSIVTVLLPSVLAGIRDSSVGYDVELYLNRIFMIAEQSKSYFRYVVQMTVLYSNVGIGFSSLVYAAAHLFEDVHWTYFFVNLMPVCLFYIAIYRNNKIKHKSFVWLVLLLVIYNVSLNLLRQIIAVSIIYFGQEFVRKKKPIKYIVTCIVAFLFHDSAIIFIAFYFVYWFIQAKGSNLRMLVGLILMIALIYAYAPVLNLIVNAGILDSRFVSSYSQGFHFGGAINLYTLFCALFVLITDVATNMKNHEDLTMNFYTTIVCLNVLCFMIGSATSEAYRIGYYTFVFLPEALEYSTRKYKSGPRRILQIILAGYAIYYWYVLIVVYKFAATIPFISDVIGWLA